MEKNNNLYWLAGIILLICSFLLGMVLKKAPVETIEKTDTLTLTQWEHDTLRIDSIFPKYIKEVKTVHDTLRTRDSIQVEVEIPIQMAHFDTLMIKDQDSVSISLNVEGYKPRLLSMQTIVNRREKTTVITNTVTKTKKPLISLSPMAGFGYGITTKKVDAFVGVGLSVNL